MKVNLGKYKNYYGPYQLAETLCFWAKKEEDEYGFKHNPDWVHDFGEWLAYGSIVDDDEDTWSLGDEREGTFLCKFLLWVDSKRKRKIKIKLDKWDTWSMDHTLAMLILPMLKQLQETKHGSPMVEDEDVPDGLGLRSTEAEPKENEWDGDSNIHDRWNWIMDEMIWAFEQLNDDDNDAQFHTGEHDIYFEKCNDGTTNSEMKTGPNDTHVFDKEGFQKHQERIQRGTTLFGKYFRGLWD